MDILILLTLTAVAGFVWHWLLARTLFRSRPKTWRYQEDMHNEGCQTSLLLLLSAGLGFATAPLLGLLVVWIIEFISNAARFWMP